ncbi:MAG: xanthine dehydrogenase family protein subunit M [Proteobacteria bacterium]|nr:xanthine dehydrogenase family protein subunit M [Pseudomonadota bacterium]
MENFDFHRPAKLADAVKLAKTKESKLLSGGMTLLPTIKQGLAAPSALIDLGGLKNSGVKVGAKSVVIAAGTVHAAVAADKGVKKAVPALSTLAGGIGDPQVRNRGTIGGSVANNDPAADYPSAVLALGATVHTNARKIAADKFFTGLFSTALKDGEIITGIEFPVPAKAGYAKFPNPASRYALVGVFVAQGKDGKVRVAVTGAGPGVFRVPEFEEALSKKFSADALNGVSVKAKGLNSDIHASAAYRAHLISVMAKRAVAAAK